MTGKSTPSLDDLRAQARRTFRYWPIYLMLRVREVEQHLTPAQLAELGSLVSVSQGAGEAEIVLTSPSQQHDPRISLLTEYGLLPADLSLPDSLPSIPEQPDIIDCTFRCEASDKSIQLICESSFRGESMQLNLLRTDVSGRSDVELVALQLNRIQQEVSAGVALEVAQLWSLLHGCRQLPWKPVTSEALAADLPPVAPPTPTLTVLPPRRRGRGQFRMPG